VVIPELRWESLIFDDPDGGKILLWPYLPCVRMPKRLRPRNWDGVALIMSSDDIISMRDDQKQDALSQGIHVKSASSSGTSLGMLVNDLQSLDVNGPSIPDPEPMRLLLHSDNSRGGMPIYAIIPNIDDDDWVDWLSRCADQQVRLRNLLAIIGRSRRWSKSRNQAIKMLKHSNEVEPDLGAAATVCAAWWFEERLGLSKEILNEQDSRLSSRLRGALSNLRNSEMIGKEPQDVVLLAPIHQAHLPYIKESLRSCNEVEEVRGES